MLAGLPFVFTIDDPGGLFAPYPALQDNLNAAGEILSGLISGKGSIEVRVAPDNVQTATARGGAQSITDVNVSGGFYTVENGTISEAKTGVDPNQSAPDVLLQFNTQSYLPTVWFDPSGAARTAPIPADKQDFIGTAMHELVHALGFQGFRTISGADLGAFTLEFPTGSGTFLQTTFDGATAFGVGDNADVLFFNGPKARAAYGGPVPLTSLGPTDATGVNFYHVGNPLGNAGDDLLPDLMNGVSSVAGVKYEPSSLDLAMLADLGLQRRSQTWNNIDLPADVTGDGNINVSDLLELVSDLRANGVVHRLDPTPPTPTPTYLDVDDDGFVSISDILFVINVLRNGQPAGEGESNVSDAEKAQSLPFPAALLPINRQRSASASAEQAGDSAMEQWLTLIASDRHSRANRF